MKLCLQYLIVSGPYYESVQSILHRHNLFSLDL
jgi:hypothetical protein